MSEETPTRIETLIAGEFDRQGWQWEPGIGGSLIGEAERLGAVEGTALAERVPADFLQRNRTTREMVAAAIDRVAGGFVPVPEVDEPSVQITVQSGDSYMVNFGPGANIQNSPFNIGPGRQILVNSQSTSEELGAALGALVAGGLAGEWDEDAARAIGAAIENQGKLSLDEAKTAVFEAGKELAPRPSRIREFTEKVAVSGLGGFITTAISLGLSDLHHLFG
jgi:hypothetical protein